MTRFTSVITNPLGFHARIVGQLIKLAKTFNCSIIIQCNGQMADLKNLNAGLGLRIKKDNQFLITCEGKDEKDAYIAIENFFKNL